MIDEIRDRLAKTLDEQRAYGLIEAWLVILRDAYLTDPAQFSEPEVNFLKEVRSAGVRLRRFAELQEELQDSIDLAEYNEAMKELKALAEELSAYAVSRRIKKEIRQLVERRDEVLQNEMQRKNAKMTDRILQLEETAERCPKDENHRLEIRQGKYGYFWACSAFPSCWYSRKLAGAELERLETP